MTQAKQTFGWVCLALLFGWFCLLLVAPKYQITPPMPTELSPEQVAMVERLKARHPKVSPVTADNGSTLYCMEAQGCSVSPPSWINPSNGDVLLDEKDEWEVAQLSNTQTFWGESMQVREYNSLRNALVLGMFFSALFFLASFLPSTDFQGRARTFGIFRWFFLLSFACLVFFALSGGGGVLPFIVFIASIVIGPLLLFLTVKCFITLPTTDEPNGEMSA